MRKERLRYSRRQLLQMLFGGSSLVPLVTGCDSLDSWISEGLPPTGELLSPNREAGHRLRLPMEDRIPDPISSNSDSVVHRSRCVIVGAGVAGLSAAWHLQQQGIEDFRVLELESVFGGTARSDTSIGDESTGEIGGSTDNGFRFPWGAHYVPVPKVSNPHLVSFLKNCGVVEAVADGRVVVREEYLCRDPEERVFAGGKWRPGLIPNETLSTQDRDELNRFRSEMFVWSQRFGSDSKPFFALPTASCSEDSEAVALDQISMAQWMEQRRFRSSVLRWLVEYSCLDDYGLKPAQTSAWAGLFYFAARMGKEAGQSQEVMTWPEGNGFLVDRMAESMQDRIDLNQAVMRISRMEGHRYRIESIDTQTHVSSAMEAEHVILAVPQFIAGRLMPRHVEPPAMTDSKHDGVSNTVAPPTTGFTYGSWLVANIHLNQRPAEMDFPMAWDNVSMSSASLGYVNSLHQTGRDHGPTILTWYTAIPDDAPEKVRERLMTLSWAEAAESVLSDLETVHPEIRNLVNRLDVMIWGHAMVQPRVGSIFHRQRKAASQRIGNIHFACTDLSGVALFEEAFDHGRRAAMEVTSNRTSTQVGYLDRRIPTRGA